MTNLYRAFLTQCQHTRRNLSPYAGKAFFQLALRWQLTRPQAMTLLGITSTSTFANWKKGQTNLMPKDSMERISYLMTIDQKFTDTNQLHHWLNSPSKVFHQFVQHQPLYHQFNPDLTEDQAPSPLSYMLQGTIICIYDVMIFSKLPAKQPPSKTLYIT